MKFLAKALICDWKKTHEQIQLVVVKAKNMCILLQTNSPFKVTLALADPGGTAGALQGSQFFRFDMQIIQNVVAS